MWTDLIGRTSAPVRNAVEQGAVRRFAEAIGDSNPLFVDEEAAARSRWGGLIAPPTFPRVFDFGAVEGLDLPKAGLIHGEQSYTYRRPLRVGESLLCRTEVRNVYEKEGRSGRLVFLVFRRTGVDATGETVFTADEVVVVTPAVREEGR